MTTRGLVTRLALSVSLLLALVMAGACGSQEPMVSPPAKPAPVAEKPSAGAPAAAEGNVHACAGVDRWFPGDPDRLGRLVDAYLSGLTPSLARPPVALIVPHAGYQFSGAIAGKAYATLKGRTYKRIILLGPSHQAAVRGASVLRADAYETPLGRIPVDTEVRDLLLKCRVVKEQPAAHLNEHSVENQLPMLQRVLGSFKMVEVLVGEMTPDERASLAAVIRPMVDDGTLLVASSDFTHFGPNYGYVPFQNRVPERLMMLVDMAGQEILQVDVPGWDAYLEQSKDTICGRAGIGLLLNIMEPWDDLRGTRIAVDTSGQQTGNWANSVTYASFAFWRAGEGLNAAEQATLLKLARDTVANYIKTRQPLRPEEKAYYLTPGLKAPDAAFVTLKNAGQLRGCIGHVIAVGPLYESVIENACNACRDPRFTGNPITAEEVAALTIEISVLSPMRRLSDPTTVLVGRDGLVMERGRARGLLLPQVPVEQGWNREQFLAQTCIKAGLPPDIWKDPQTEIYRFSAQVFGEGKASPKQEKAAPKEEKVAPK